MPRGAGCSRGVPARLACLLLLALIAVVCLTTGADARKRPAACPTNADGTPACNSCVKKNCKFDDRCYFNKAGANSPTSPNAVCVTAATKLDPDVCRGVQRKHGKNAPAVVSAIGVAGKSGKRARCQASVVPQNNGTVACGCMNKNMQPAKKRCKFCVPVTPITICNTGPNCPKDIGTGGDVPPPPPLGPPPPPSPPPPPPVGPSFLKNNTMTMQGGVIKYTPSNGTGNWTTLCQIPQMAKAIAYGAEVKVGTTTTPNSAYILSVWDGTLAVAGLADLYPDKPTTYNSAVINKPTYMEGTQYFDNAKAWYTGGLPKTSSGASNGGMAPSGYTGTGKDFLDNYFKSAVQNPPNTKALSGSTSGSANAQIFMKTSAYWVAVTHVMYNLDMAEKNIAANNTAAAKANFDSVAAAYYGCGDTNPVPLPTYNGAQLTYPTTASTPDTGMNATTMSIYGVANKRADNYGTAGLVSTNTASCTGTSVPTATCKAVAALNVEVAAALNAGPTVANADIVRDATLTIFTQAAQRYAAKLTLAAQLPGDGMGGSTYHDQLTSTTAPTQGSYIPSTVFSTSSTKNMQTACGGGASSVVVTARSTTVVGIADANKVSGVNSCGTSGLVSTKGSPASNTATFGAVMAALSSAALPNSPSTVVSPATPGVPYSVLPTNLFDDAVTVANNGQGGSLTSNILKATRGLPPSSAPPAGTVPPIACIGPTVKFAAVVNTGNAAANGAVVATHQQAVSLCNPQGLLPPAVVSAQAAVNDRVAQYKAVGAGAASGAIRDQVEFWDPITAALLTEGAYCCDSQVYSAEGLGMVGSGVTGASNIRNPSTFVPPFVGGDMSGSTTATALTAKSPGGMCPVSGNNILGLSAYASPTEVNLLEGQAFYAVIAPMQYTMQKTSTVVTTQQSNAAKQRVCAETLTKMYKVNQTPATTATDAGGCENPNGGAALAGGLSGVKNCRGSDVNAINYPIWKVKIGSAPAGTGGTDYFVPNGYCYANACFEDFATVGLNSSFKGATKLAALVKSPDMSSNPTTTGTAPLATGACGRANKACAAPPASWTGGAAEFVLCPITNVAGGTTTCTTAQKEAQMGRLPSST